MELPATPLDTKIRATFVVLAVLCWYGATLVTENLVAQLAVLLLVGLGLPQVAVELLDRRN